MAADGARDPGHTATFDGAATLFGRLGPVLWNPLGERLVELAAPLAGERVLDVCCGTGASAIPAARAGAIVEAIDLSEAMIAVARAAAGGERVRFAHADATTWHGGPYDVVLSGYGVFFLPDMDRDCARLVGLLRPGGRFAMSTWRDGAFGVFRDVLERAVEDVTGAAPPRRDSRAQWAALRTPDALTAWLASIGLVDVRVVEVGHAVRLDDRVAWTLVLGMTTRALVDGLPAADQERVRVRLLDRLAADGVTAVDASSLLAVGSRPA